MQARAAEDLKKLVTEKLTAAGLHFGKAEAFVTPRRLALVVEGLPHQTGMSPRKRKARAVGSPDQAIQGFLKGAGLDSLDACEKRIVGKAEFWFAVIQKKGVESAQVLPALLVDAIHALPWPKSMRFADATLRWVRPAAVGHGVVRQQGAAGRAAAWRIAAALAFDDGTKGHRFLAPAPFKVRDFREYRARLKDAHVILDREERKALIESDLKRLAAEHGLTLKEDRGLLEEVCGLVEWPLVLVGRLDPRFIDLPPEVLSTSMRQHQKYFTLLSGRKGHAFRRRVEHGGERWR